MTRETPIPPADVRRKVMGAKLLAAYREWERRKGGKGRK